MGHQILFYGVLLDIPLNIVFVALGDRKVYVADKEFQMVYLSYLAKVYDVRPMDSHKLGFR